MLSDEDRERLIRIDVNVEQLVTKAADHETRLRSLERFKNWLIGIFGFGAAGGGVSQL